MINKKDTAAIDDTKTLINQYKRAEAAEEDMKDLEAIEGFVARENSESLQERDLANEIFGRIQAMKAMANFADVVSIHQLKEIKEKKLYQALKGKIAYDRQGQKLPTVGSWEGFCKAIGSSKSKVDEDIRSLETFGQEAFEQLGSMGVSYRTLRKLRKLPEEEREAVINGEAINLGDKDQVIDLIEEMSARHAREKQQLKDKNQELTNQLETDRQLLADKDQKINELDREINQKLSPEQQKQKELEKNDRQINSLKQLSVESIKNFSQMQAQIEAIIERNDLAEHVLEAAYNELRLVIDRAMGLVTDFNIEPSLIFNSPEWRAAYNAHKECEYGKY
ncbi:hypothetical protein NX722_25275 [Endozoicomonas gorgoniicola]|uniref:DUF3102 domain-containing protein n=1 Tax=Endozoicomonas gorgoniicola TaxID=1234144 RepID=A0ABT3N2P0_9GAMM|nr:hypothetical protein [Endozoicomonas gorgoniicola]MCW7555879.1 hypothetical protein [Endozoicomonas gorgoniicola]